MTEFNELQLLDSDFDITETNYDDRTNFDMTWEDANGNEQNSTDGPSA